MSLVLLITLPCVLHIIDTLVLNGAAIISEFNGLTYKLKQSRAPDQAKRLLFNNLDVGHKCFYTSVRVD